MVTPEENVNLEYSARGGYQILDFGKIVVSMTEGRGTPVTIPGIFDKVNTIFPIKKPVVAYNIIADADGEVIELPPVYISDVEKYTTDNVTSIYITVASLIVEVTSNDTYNINSSN